MGLRRFRVGDAFLCVQTLERKCRKGWSDICQTGVSWSSFFLFCFAGGNSLLFCGKNVHYFGALFLQKILSEFLARFLPRFSTIARPWLEKKFALISQRIFSFFLFFDIFFVSGSGRALIKKALHIFPDKDAKKRLAKLRLFGNKEPGFQQYFHFFPLSHEISPKNSMQSVFPHI